MTWYRHELEEGVSGYDGTLKYMGSCAVTDKKLMMTGGSSN